jgi:AmmeMemoRadiSam system protein B
MTARKPVVADRFYAGSRSGCLAELEECLSARPVKSTLPQRIVAGLVPHAGWTFSGDLAGLVFSAVRQVHDTVDTFIIFGASHRYMGPEVIVYDKGSWITPLGDIDIDQDLAAEIAAIKSVRADLDIHNTEHSIEVQVPFIQHLFAQARIVPVLVPSSGFDLSVGEKIGDIISAQTDKTIVCIASSDLTHYGPGYGFYPEGGGPDGIRWAKEVNDRDFIDLALAMKAQELLSNSMEKSNACGPGAVAMAIEVAKKLGKTEGILLAHTHSSEVMARKYNRSSTDTVGYAAIIY